MKKRVLIAILICMSFFGYSQKIDTVFTTQILKSYFSTTYKEPLFVTYGLYHGGGDASRAGLSFKSVKGITATDAQYSHSGYDQGHLANAEDFANSDTNIRLTFFFYNCLPQTPNLNRGIWKNWETTVREESQKDSLMIVCGGYDFKLINKLYVPTYCFKIVKNTKTNKIVHVLIFTNTLQGNTCEETTLDALIKKSKYTKLKALVK